METTRRPHLILPHGATSPLTEGADLAQWRLSRRHWLRGIGTLGVAAAAGVPVLGAAAAGGGLTTPTRRIVSRQSGGDAPWQARHGLDADAHQAEFDWLSSQGYRPLRVSGYSVNGVDYYASIWEQSPGGAWVARHRLDAAAYQAEFDFWLGEGYRPVDVSGYELDGRDFYAAIWYQGWQWGWDARHGLTAADYQAAVDQFIAAGYRPLHVAGYTVNGQDRYATIWEQSPGPAWAARHGLDAESYQAEFDFWAASGYRPVDVSGYSLDGRDYYAAIWYEESGVAWAARHGLDEADYQAVFDDLTGQGYRPRCVAGFGSGGRARYAAIWEQAGGGGDLVGIDGVVQRSMTAAGVPGVSVAIARDGRLVFAKGYGVADPASGEAVRVDHRFRIASVAKPITAVAIMSLIEAGWLNLDDQVFGRGGLLGTEYGSPPYTDDIEAITVRHLLEHTAGGWTNDGTDPMFARPELFGAEFITWVLDNYTLQTWPGTNHAYSNFGYCLLGRIVEHLTGQAYDAFVRDAILAACGVFTMEIAGDTLADRRFDEVTYDGTNFPEGGRPYEIPVTRMDSHGGWLATATDLVRFAVRVDGFATVPDILAAGTIAEMTTPSAANANYAKGWAVNDLNNWWHNGKLAGTESILVRTSGGFCWAALANGNGIDLDAMVWDMVDAADDWPLDEPL